MSQPAAVPSQCSVLQGPDWKAASDGRECTAEPQHCSGNFSLDIAHITSAQISLAIESYMTTLAIGNVEMEDLPQGGERICREKVIWLWFFLKQIIVHKFPFGVDSCSQIIQEKNLNHWFSSLMQSQMRSSGSQSEKVSNSKDMGLQVSGWESQPFQVLSRYKRPPNVNASILPARIAPRLASWVNLPVPSRKSSEEGSWEENSADFFGVFFLFYKISQPFACVYHTVRWQFTGEKLSLFTIQRLAWLHCSSKRWIFPKIRKA